MNLNIKLSHQIHDLSDLTNEEKLIEITLNMEAKQSMNQIIGSQNILSIPDDEVKELLKDSLDDIRYIVDSPRFEIIYNDDDKIVSKTIVTFSMMISSKNDVISLFKNYPNRSFIFYNLLVDSFSRKYILRGAFIDDLQKRRDNIINKILE